MSHICHTEDGMQIVCLCRRGQSHDESEFDIEPAGEAS